MSRRRRKPDPLDTVEVVFKVGIGLFGLALISPGVRQWLGRLLIIAVGTVILGLVGFVAYRLIVRALEKPEPPEAFQEFEPRAVELDTVVAPKIPAITTEYRPVPERLQPPDLLEQLNKIDWFQFEKIVGLVYRKFGYNVDRRGGANPDGGIDLVIEKDGVLTAVQCKQWKTWNVGVKAVREFLGGMTDAKIQKGIFVTLRGYTGEAKQLAEKHGIQILNETHLADLLKATEVVNDPEALEILRDRTKYCPKCERKMDLKTARKGRGAGQQFWACPGYPFKCQYTMPYDEATDR